MKNISTQTIVIVSGILGVLSAVFGFDSAKGLYDAAAFHWLVIPLVLALVVAVAALGWSTVQGYLHRSRSNRDIDKLDRFKLKACQHRDIEAVQALASKHFEGATDAAETRRLHGLDSGIFNILVDTSNRNQVCGYLCIIKLTKKGHQAILDNDFKVSRLPRDYVHKAPRRAYEAVYIGAVVGAGREERAFMLMAFKSKLKRLQPNFVYARAATPDGLRVLTKYNFQPMFGLGAAVGNLFQLTRATNPDLWDDGSQA